MDDLTQILTVIDDSMYTYVLIILLVISGLYFTIRTKAVQFTLFKNAIKTLTNKDEDEVDNSDGKKGKKKVNSFQALMISTASRVGTGNIAGVAVAIAVGGAGSVFWMWILALIGAASAFIESTLAQIYKVRDGEGFRGGPAYYMEQGLKKRWVGILFAIFLIICFGYGFNALQTYNVGAAVKFYFGDSYTGGWAPYMVGGILALLTAVCIWGGVHRIGVISSYVVPIMASLYIIFGLYATFSHISSLPGIFQTIFSQAFDFKAIFGGLAGSCLVYGAKRGLFSNEAGMGSAPNASATADVSHPVKQGLVQFISVFIDTLLICSTTALMLLTYTTTPSETDMDYVQNAMSYCFGDFGIHFITAAIVVFAFTSQVGNYCYAESNLKFIIDKHKKINTNLVVNIFRVTVVLVVFYGALASFDLVWSVADISMGLMAILNIITIFILGNIAIKALNNYRGKLKKGKKITFKSSEIGLEDTECWK